MMKFFRKDKRDENSPAPRRSWKSRFMALALVVMFVTGYTATTSVVQTCAAQGVAGNSCFTWPMNSCGACVNIGWTEVAQGAITYALKQVQQMATRVLEQFTHLNMVRMVGSLLTGINSIETNTKDWTQNFWHYNLLPALQGQTNQYNAAVADKSRAVGSAIDATNQAETRLVLEKRDIQNLRDNRPAENVCVAASGMGGMSRVSALNRAMRDAMERQSLEPGLNKVGSPGAEAAVGAELKRHLDFESTYCDPESNGGEMDCDGIPAFYNADTQPTKFIFNKLTIDVLSDPLMMPTVETIVNNMVGVPSADPIKPGAIASVDGMDAYLERRSLLAQYAAVRTVPHWTVGARMPGSQMGEWAKVLGEKAGVPVGDLSANPSYREVMHRAVIDRFNTGRFAVGMITDKQAIELEKLTLSVFQLMLLRDYYELLERKALTLAVQVSLMTEQAKLPDVTSERPLKP